MTHCSSKWGRPIFLEIKSNENRGADKLSFAFIVSLEENQKYADIYFDTKSLMKMKFFANNKRRNYVSSCYVWDKRLYYLMAQLIEALRHKSEGHGFDSR